MGRSTAGYGHPRVVLIASECNHKCNHRGRAGWDAIACQCADPTLETLSYGGGLGVIRGMIGVSARTVTSAEVGITVL